MRAVVRRRIARDGPARPKQSLLLVIEMRVSEARGLSVFVEVPPGTDLLFRRKRRSRVGPVFDAVIGDIRHLESEEQVEKKVHLRAVKEREAASCDQVVVDVDLLGLRIIVRIADLAARDREMRYRDA